MRLQGPATSRSALGTAVLVIGLFSCCVAPGAAPAAGGRQARPAEAAAPIPDQSACEPTWFVSPEVAFARSKREPGLVLADVRGPADHARLRVAGSLGIPLAFVKAGGFLRGRPVILVGDGFQNAGLLAECRNLRKLGFDAAVLAGGLPAWELRGFPLEGDRLELAALRRVTPRALYQEKDAGGLTVVDVSREGRGDVAKFFPAALHLPGGPPGRLDTGRLRAATGKPGACPNALLVVSEAGGDYAPVARQLAAAGINAFFLEGGLSGYRRHVNELALSWQPREARVRTVSPCRPCGEKKVPDENP